MMGGAAFIISHTAKKGNISMIFKNHLFGSYFTPVRKHKNGIFRTCLHKKCVRNFVADKAKIHRQAVA